MSRDFIVNPLLRARLVTTDGRLLFLGATHRSVRLSVGVSVCPWVSPSVRLFVGVSVCPWVSPSVRGSVRLSVGLFVSTDDSVPNPGAGILDVPRTADSVLVSCEEDGPRELH